MWRNRLYLPIRRLGQGESSSVWLAKDTETNELVTIKGTDLACLDSYKALDHLRNEQRSLEFLKRELTRPPNPDMPMLYSFPTKCLRVAKLVKVFHEAKRVVSLDSAADGVLYFVLEFIPGAPLNKHIAISKGLPEQTVRFYTAELVRILGALHERGVIYRDLKASNIIVEHRTGRLVLIDFGFAKYIGFKGKTRSYCGTLHAMPPEVLSKGRNLASDLEGFNMSNLSPMSPRIVTSQSASILDYQHDQSNDSSNTIQWDNQSITMIESMEYKQTGCFPSWVISGLRSWSSSALSAVEGLARNPLVEESRDLGTRSGLSTSLSSPNLVGHSSVQSKLMLYRTDCYGVEVDWWSLGVLVYEMLFCQPPFGFYDYSIDRCQTIEQLARRSPFSISFPESPLISNECKEFIIDLLQADPLVRLGVQDDARSIQAHPWFNNFPWDRMDDQTFSPPYIMHQFNESDY